MTTNIFIIHESVLSLYKTMYNDNKYFNYTRDYIMTTNIFIIHESVFLLYKTMYNKTIFFVIIYSLI